MESIPEFTQTVIANAMGGIFTITVVALVTWLRGKWRNRKKKEDNS